MAHHFYPLSPNLWPLSESNCCSWKVTKSLFSEKQTHLEGLYIECMSPFSIEHPISPLGASL